MISCIAICGITCLTMILSILFFPKIRIGGDLKVPVLSRRPQAVSAVHGSAGALSRRRQGRVCLSFKTVTFRRFQVDTYWVVTLAGALILLFSGRANLRGVAAALTADSAINPLKILVLFISMTVLSIYLDELGFFSFLASLALRKAKSSQYALFGILYLTVSVLTVFTSNDIIILTFTPFICFFAKNAKISPLPYLFAEFIAANTWSMALVIGNPTNVYLATANGVDFLSYTATMILPTLAAGAVSFILLFAVFRRDLKKKIEVSETGERIRDKTLLVIGIAHLGLCTLTLAVGSYIGLEMWLASLFFAVSLLLCTLAVSVGRRRKPVEILACLKRAPWQLVPFVLSMFVMILALGENGVTPRLTALLSGGATVFRYGFSSFFAANIINNIPMSVLFSSIAGPLSGIEKTRAVYAATIGSNIGAFLTPVGALAGIMWSSILRSHGVKFSFLDFVKYGAAVALPAVTAALCALSAVL
ncbi:MAG: hypothetical protein IJU52_06475 [Clostridia bacterium]|nr:hypothetical protein [Clostridia bacterium]